MHPSKAIIASFGALAILASTQIHAKTINAEALAEMYLSNDDSWTTDKTSLYLNNTKSCTAKVKYEHDGKTKTIGTCTHKGNEDDLRGDFYFDYGVKVLYESDASKGFSLAAKSVKCHYQLQHYPYPSDDYYYAVDCKLAASNATITPFGGACTKAASVKITEGGDGLMLTPTCTDN